MLSFQTVAIQCGGWSLLVYPHKDKFCWYLSLGGWECHNLFQLLMQHIHSLPYVNSLVSVFSCFVAVHKLDSAVGDNRNMENVY